MTVNEGLEELLTLLQSYLAGYNVELLGGPTVINPDVTYTDLTFASWTGYAPQPVSSLAAVTIDTDRARCSPLSYPTFVNSSGSTQYAYGYAIVDPVAEKLIAAKEFDTPVAILDGGTQIVLLTFWLADYEP